jgi:hypothetical protein
MDASGKTGWAGWIAGPVGWFVHQQVGSATNYWDCSAGRPLLVIALGMACALIVVIGGAASWRGLRRAGRAGGPSGLDGGGNGRFIAIMGLMMASVFLVAVIGQTMAGFAFTGCER